MMVIVVVLGVEAWGGGCELLTSHVMTNSERLPPPPLTLAGVTFGAGGGGRQGGAINDSIAGDFSGLIRMMNRLILI